MSSLRMDVHGPSHREQVSALEIQTLQNYEAAKNYYIQKKVMFLQQGLRKNLQDNQKAQANLARAIQQTVGNIVTEQWQPIKNTILQSAGNPTLFNGAAPYKLSDQRLVGVPQNIKEELIAGIGSDKNIYSILGPNYEAFLADAFGKIGGEVAYKGVKKCLSDFVHSGKISMYQAGRKGSVQIMSDVSKNVVDNPNANLSVSIDIAQANVNNNFMSYTDVVNYLTSGMFGMQCKLYSLDHSSWPLTRASMIQQEINTIFKNVVNNHTWNIQYAQTQILHTVSRFLLDILSPINIAFIDKNGLIWMDDFLDSHILSMTLDTPNGHVHLNENTYTEIHPVVKSDEIKIRKYQVQKAISRVHAGQSVGIVSSGSAYAANNDLTQFTIATYLKRLK